MENIFKCNKCQEKLTLENCYVSSDKKYKNRNGFLYQCKSCIKKAGQVYLSTENGKTMNRLKEARRRLKNKERYLWKSALNRSKSKGLEFNIEESDIIIPETCPIFGCKLIPSDGVNDMERNNSPSLDRIDSSKGYIKGNVVVISNRANSLKNNASFEEIKNLFLWMNKIYNSPKDNE